jgi:Ser/Thr protein kinase RdoA (MazF antagonist)
VAGLLDFGDLVWTARVCEAAIAATYAMFETADPAASGARVLAGYHEILGLERAEVRAVPRLIDARLCVSVTMSAYRQSQEPENEYLSVSEESAWELLGRMTDTPVSHWVEPFEEACTAVRPFGDEDAR